MDLATATRDACGDVEEGEAQALAPTGPELLGEAEDADPAGDVVGERGGEGVHQLPRKLCSGAWFSLSAGRLTDIWRKGSPSECCKLST